MIEIENIDDIKKLVDTFYGKVRKDELIGPIFNEVIQDTWPEHLDKMYRFWQTMLLREHTYYGAPVLPHLKLPVKRKHFERWLALFDETLRDDFIGKTAEEASWRAHKMAEMFQLKINYHQENKSTPSL